jgi:hypothetical protein
MIPDVKRRLLRFVFCDMLPKLHTVRGQSQLSAWKKFHITRNIYPLWYGIVSEQLA